MGRFKFYNILILLLLLWACKKEKFPINKEYELIIDKCQYYYGWQYYNQPIKPRKYILKSYENNILTFTREFYQSGLSYSYETQFLNVLGDSVYGHWNVKTGPTDTTTYGKSFLPEINFSGYIKEINKKWIISGEVIIKLYHISGEYLSIPALAKGVFKIKQTE